GVKGNDHRSWPGEGRKACRTGGDGRVRAELVTIGTELLLGQIVNTNAAALAARLTQVGLDCYYVTTVGDNWTRLAEVLAQALGRSDVVITSGGLGPTQDDLTREVAAAVLGVPLEERPELWEAI